MFSGYRTILSRSTLRRTFASAIPDGLTLSHLHVSQPLPWELAAADALQGSFTSGVLLGQRDLPAEFFVPRDAAAALATGTRVQKLMTSSAKFQQTPIGFKIGATSKKAQDSLGLAGPFPGPIFEETTFTAPAQVLVAGRHVRGVEAEFGFEMRRTIMPVPCVCEALPCPSACFLFFFLPRLSLPFSFRLVSCFRSSTPTAWSQRRALH